MLLGFIIHKFPYSLIHESHFIDLRNISTSTKTEEILLKHWWSKYMIKSHWPFSSFPHGFSLSMVYFKYLALNCTPLNSTSTQQSDNDEDFDVSTAVVITVKEYHTSICSITRHPKFCSYSPSAQSNYDINATVLGV